MLTGSITACYPDTDQEDETAVAGEVYFFPAGHILKYRDQTSHLEFNPAYALQHLMNAIQQVADRATGTHPAG
ncbi:hypothetical protein [Rhodococcus pyridinivorans]|uniref:hypothetical protein n=1 Tax=Rhodococcus pyridinivorans TaxID=103816 RepID=UPI001EE6C654|nr:hypothetical protein [Rhodococcus pyridinivorans]